MRQGPGGLSEQEFLALPRTMRRKYFSSLERLRLAQDGAFPAPPSPRKGRMLLRGGLGNRLPRPALKRKSFYLTRSSSRRLLRTSQSVKSQYRAPQIDATWFSSLPEKIRQCQFSREEQELLAGKRESIILDAADEAVHRLGCQPETPVGTLCTDAAFQRNQNNYHNRDNCAAGQAIHPASSMDSTFYDSFRWLDEDDDFDLTLADYHNAVSETTHPAPLKSRQFPSVCPALPLAPVNHRRNSESTKRPQSSHSAVPRPGFGHGARPSSISSPGPCHQRHSSVSSIEPLAKHYKDPEARLKLRVYLASPQKFDEAIEFGFPSSNSTIFVQPPAAAANSARIQETERSFLDDTASSLPTDKADQDDDVSLAGTNSPPTPPDAIFQSSGRSEQDILHRRGMLRPHVTRTLPDPYACKPPRGREMTLHMTLTRPDLRTETGIRPSSDKTDDPLRLSDLPLSDEKHAIWEPVADDRSKVKRLWKKLTSR